MRFTRNPWAARAFRIISSIARPTAAADPSLPPFLLPALLPPSLLEEEGEEEEGEEEEEEEEKREIWRRTVCVMGRRDMPPVVGST